MAGGSGEEDSGSLSMIAELSGEGREKVQKDMERSYTEMREREGVRGKWVRSSVTYVAGGLSFQGPTDDPQVLLIQESKPSCMGKWYLPMGRVEPGEELAEGAVREVKEESGLDVRVGRLLVASTNKASWHRFVFACDVIGGRLKTDSDSESMAAAWWPVKDVLNERIPMRGHTEIYRTIRFGCEQYRKSAAGKVEWPLLGSLTCIEPAPSLVYRLCLSQKGESEVVMVLGEGLKKGLKVLMGTGSWSLPSVAVPPGVHKPRYYMVEKLRSLLGESAASIVAPPIAISLRSHLSPQSNHTGLCLTLLFPLVSTTSLTTSAHLITPPPHYQWTTLNEDATERLQFLRAHGSPYYFK